MRNPFSFAAFPSLGAACSRTSPKEAQRAVYADPAFRNAFREELKNATGFSGDWAPHHRARGAEARAEAIRGHGRSPRSPRRAARTASTRSSTWRSRTTSTSSSPGVSSNARGAHGASNLTDPRADRAGRRRRACRHAVRRRLSDLPARHLGARAADHDPGRGDARLTAQPADLFGIKGRGRLRPGSAADVAIFDPDTIGSASRGERRYDLPGGAKRMVMPSRGVEYTIVNGAVTWEQGQLTEAKAGKVLRGYVGPLLSGARHLPSRKNMFLSSCMAMTRRWRAALPASALQRIRHLLGDHDRREVRVGAHDGRHHRGIDHAQAGDGRSRGTRDRPPSAGRRRRPCGRCRWRAGRRSIRRTSSRRAAARQLFVDRAAGGAVLDSRRDRATSG